MRIFKDSPKPNKSLGIKESIRIIKMMKWKIHKSKIEKSETLKTLNYKSFLQILQAEEFIDIQNEFIEQNNIFSISELSLCLSNPKHLKFMKILSQYHLPYIHDLFLFSVPHSNKHLTQFISNSLPSQLQNIQFNFRSKSILPLAPYYKSLRGLATHVFNNNAPTMFIIQKMIVTQQEFCSLVKASKRSRTVGFLACVVLTEFECNFEITGNCKTEVLELRYTGSAECSDWNTHPHRFIHILKGISNCESLNKSLKEIWLHDCGMDKKQERETLDEYMNKT